MVMPNRIKRPSGQAQDVRGILAAVAMAVLVAGGSAAAQAPQAGTVATTLYLHLQDIQDMAINTQAPPDGLAEDVTVGLVTASTSCASGGPLQAYEFHTHRGFGLMGHMDYSHRPPRAMHEGYVGGGGLWSDVHLVGEEMVLHWYWSTETSDPFDLGAQLPLVVPDVVVEATLREGQGFGMDDGLADGGSLLAHGRSAPATLAGEQSNGVAYQRVGDRHVYHFEVPLRIERDVIPSALGYNLRVDTFVLRDGCPSGGYLTPNLLALHTSVDHRPRLELTTSDRPTVTVLYAGPRGGPNATSPPGSIVIHAEVSSPWGKQDVAAVELTILGPSEAYSLVRLEAPSMVHCHCPPTPLQATWLWDAAYDQAPPGRYEVTVTAVNLQGTAMTVATVPLDLRYEQAAPAVGAPLMIVGLAAVGLALHRRR